MQPVEVSMGNESVPAENTTVLADRFGLVEDMKEKTSKQEKLISDLIKRKISEISYDNLDEVEDLQTQLARIANHIENTLFPNKFPGKQR